ncbi:MAG TPA: DUF4831 family protein [Bacteroidales bacterium]|nr:DUF4831 family protein [Bacteroidales bacterium]
MKRKGIFYFMAAVMVGFNGCSTVEKAANKGITVTPLGEEVKVTDGTLVYALPLTVFEIDVAVERTVTIPGPYATFASELLGLNKVISSENETWKIVNIDLKSGDELDPSQFYVVQGTTLMQSNAFALKHSGLILDVNPDVYSDKCISDNQDQSGYPDLVFHDLGVDEYVSYKSDTAYRLVKADTAFIKIPYLVQKKSIPSLEEEASAAAKKLLELREGKHLILTGEANVFPQNEAAINEMNRLEKEYTELFTGKKWSEIKHFRFWFTPQPSMAGGKTTIFNFSAEEGVKNTGNSKGQPVYIEMMASGKTKDLNLVVRPVTSKNEVGLSDRLYYRVPDIADIRITNGSTVFCTARKLVYQFGSIVALPSNYIIGK